MENKLKKKSILVDARWIRSLNIDGIGNFTLNVLIELTKNTQFDFFIIINSQEIENLLKYKFQNIEINFIQHNFDINSIKGSIKLLKIIKKIKPNVFFSPNLSITGFLFIKNHYVVIHDLIPLKFPELFKSASLKFKLFYATKVFQKLSILTCKKVIAVSQNTKKDVKEILKIKEEKIKVITEGVTHFETELNREFLSKKFNINNDYLLFVGRHERYKNIDKVINAYLNLPENIKENLSLVIIGKSNNLVTPNLKKLGKENKKIIFLESLSPQDLSLFYKNAKILVHLSEYEGFGLTVLEAMSYGIPVIASNISSIPEVVGDSSFLVDINKEKEIIDKITILINDIELYKKISKSVKERSKIFTWKKTSEQLIHIFDF
ncbi:MAG: glycosyltransferase family 4 protein [Candidatus Sericytochromatia bacterium]